MTQLTPRIALTLALEAHRKAVAFKRLVSHRKERQEPLSDILRRLESARAEYDKVARETSRELS